MKEWRHPAWVREIRRRTRLERWMRAVGLSLLAAMPVALGAFVAWRRGAIEVLWSPAYLVPVLFLQVLVWGALWIRSRTGLTEVVVSSEGLMLVRRGLALAAPRGAEPSIADEAVTSLSALDRPWGRVLLVSGRDERQVALLLGLDGALVVRNFLDRLPLETEGLSVIRELVARIPSSEAYESMLRSEPDFGSREFDELLDCHEALGCWVAASEQILALAEAAGPTKDDLERLWRVERMLLPMTGLYRFLTRASQVIPEVVVADRLRLGMALGFRREVEAMFADTHRVDHLPGSLAALPLDTWERARKSGAPFRSGLLHSFVPQGHVNLSAEAVDLGGGRVLPLEFVVAVMARPGFIGIRSVVLFDIWGQRHEVPSRVLDRDPDAWVAALRSRAPHLLELRDGFGPSPGRSLALVDRLIGS